MNLVYKLFEQKKLIVDRYDELDERLQSIENTIDDRLLQPILDKLIEKIQNEHLVCVNVVELVLIL